MLLVNETPYPFEVGITVADLAQAIKPGADLYIVNGYPCSESVELNDGDSCWLIRRGEKPDAEEMERLLYARHTPGVHDLVKNSSVGIMGLGGLGSAVATALARIGIGRLLLVDYDLVEPSNLNRQYYFVDQVGMKKTEAMLQNLARVNPYLRIDTVDTVLTEKSIADIFAEVDILVECFDSAEMKAAALRCALTSLKGKGFVGASGLAGYEDNNTIVTNRIKDRVYIVGDGETAAAPGQGLMAPRVGIAAHHQANQVLRMLLGKE